MPEIARYEIGRRVRGTAVTAVAVAVFAAMMILFFPSIEASGVDFEAYIDSLPPAFRNAFGVEAFTTIEGFLAAEFYNFVWVLLLGLYAAYAAAGAIAGKVEDGRIELTLAGPISRTRYLVETALALSIPFLVFNLVGPVAVAVGVPLIDESMPFADLAAVHLLSLPYLAVCGAIGLALSVVVDRAAVAERAALGTIFLLFVLESVAANTDFSWLVYLSPTHYYDPTAILVRSEYALVDAAILLAAAVALLVVARTLFVRRDL